jgi:tetratricopeptide (TPR) repeat protein
MSIAIWSDNRKELAYALEASLPRIGGTPELWCALGEIYYNTLFDSPKAIKAYKKAIQLDSKYALAWAELGMAQQGKEQYKQAQKSFSKAIRLGLSQWELYLQLANVSVQIQDYKTACKGFEKSLEIEPNQPEAWNAYGNMLNDKLQMHEKALACFDKVITIDKNAYWAIYNKGLAYKRMKQYDKAIEQYNKSLAIYPNYKEAWDGLGISYLNLRKLKEAKRHFQYNLDNHTYYSSSVYNMACVYAVEGNKKQALAYLKKSLEMNREDYVDWVKQDVDFESLWQDEDFLALLA